MGEIARSEMHPCCRTPPDAPELASPVLLLAGDARGSVAARHARTAKGVARGAITRILSAASGLFSS